LFIRDLDPCKYLYCTECSVHCNVIIGTIYLKHKPRCIILSQHAQLPLEGYVFTHVVASHFKGNEGAPWRLIHVKPRYADSPDHIFPSGNFFVFYILLLIPLVLLATTLTLTKKYPSLPKATNTT
jgi:hypothetical protein